MARPGEAVSDPETELRALWDAQGVPVERQEAVLRQVRAAASPGAWVGPWRIAGPCRTELTAGGEQFVLPGAERIVTDRPGVQLTLWD
jgi:hypothetical protein